MSNIQWWRSWHGAPIDHKWAVIAKKANVIVGIVSAVAWALMDYASQHKERGSIEGFDIETYSVYSGFNEIDVQSVINAMISKGMIVDNIFVNWEKRQPAREDNSTERVSRYRAKKRNVTQCNADDSNDTPQIKREIKIKDTDTDTDKENEHTDAQADPFDVTQFFLEKLTGIMPTGKKDVDAISEIIKMGATKEDIENGFEWLQSKNKYVRYFSTLVEPTRTAMLKRIQNGNGHAAKPYDPANDPDAPMTADELEFAEQVKRNEEEAKRQRELLQEQINAERKREFERYRR